MNGVPVMTSSRVPGTRPGRPISGLCGSLFGRGRCRPAQPAGRPPDHARQRPYRSQRTFKVGQRRGCQLPDTPHDFLGMARSTSCSPSRATRPFNARTWSCGTEVAAVRSPRIALLIPATCHSVDVEVLVDRFCCQIGAAAPGTLRTAFPAASWQHCSTRTVNVEDGPIVKSAVWLCTHMLRTRMY